jgi:anti-sigma-K factor RskA
MNVKEYISSGILELYIAGLLSEKENLEVQSHAQKSPEIQSEIEAIEASILELSKSVSPGGSRNFDIVKQKIEKSSEVKVVNLKSKDRHWTRYTGWAASVLLASGLIWMYTQNRNLQSDIQIVHQENEKLEQQITDSDASLEKSQDLLQTIRDKNIAVVSLGGQAVSPKSYAKVYWNKTEEKVFIDAQGLPEPPKGFVYQVWSLKLSPLTPTSIGLLSDFASDENKVFTLANVNESEAFGITLEPAGGSESPNLEQLYTLGVVANS